MVLTGIGDSNRGAFESLLPNWKREDAVEIGVIEENKAVGAAVFTEEGKTLFLQHLFVTPKFRRRGLATAMLNGFLEEVKADSTSDVLVNFRDNVEGVEPFLREQEFRLFRDAEIFRLPTEELLFSKPMEILRKRKHESRTIPIGELLSHEREALSRLLLEEELEVELITDSGLYEPLSFVIFHPVNGTPKSAVFCERTEKTITVLLLANFTHDANDLAELFAAMAKRAEREGLTDTELVFLSNQDGIIETTKRLMKDPGRLKKEGGMFIGLKRLKEGDFWLRDFILNERKGA